MTTKILALTDALGNLVRFVLLPGQRFDTIGVPPLIDGLGFDALIADEAFDSNAVIAALDARGVYRSTILRHRSALKRPWAGPWSARPGPGRVSCSRAAR
jgi:transposase